MIHWKTRKKRLLALVCALVLILGCAGCSDKKSDAGNGSNAENKTPSPTIPVTGTPTPEPTAEPTAAPNGKTKELTTSSGKAAEGKPMDDVMKKAYEAFAYNLFRETGDGNRMVSPFSIYAAFGMLANGADNETLAQINNVLGLKEDERNAYFEYWTGMLTKKREKGPEFTCANSVWILDEIAKFVPKTFLDKVSDSYRAAVFSSPFDAAAVTELNRWVEANTKGMIKKLIDKFPPDLTMVLLNAISFEANWEVQFEEDGIQKNFTFTREDGTKTKVDMMFGEANGIYLHNSLATGFIKNYEGGEFKYLALLPNEGVTVKQLVASLEPGTIADLIKDAYHGEVTIGMPKYEAEYECSLVKTMQALGMKDVFEIERADLTRMIDVPNSNSYVAEVLHKTFISVDAKGTKAAAATGIFVATESVAIGYNVTLDRPFVYMILDANNLPIFLGTYE
ncbi:MAG: serpin family protein [Lachnospiraceae bacterium]|nr:serpin family protein [Lachnospiraceae bacterium]